MERRIGLKEEIDRRGKSPPELSPTIGNRVSSKYITLLF